MSTFAMMSGEDPSAGPQSGPESLSGLPESLCLYFDGACEPNPGGWATYGWVLTTDSDAVLLEGHGVASSMGDRRSTNNFAEYCALGFGLRHLLDSGWRGSLTICGDSMLVINQVRGSWQCKAEHLKPLLARCKGLLRELAIDSAFAWVPREQNSRADALSQLAYVEATGQRFPERRPR